MTASYGRNAVPTRLRAGNPPVTVVIVLLQRTQTAGSWWLACLGTLLTCTSAAGLTHGAIAIAVVAVGVMAFWLAMGSVLPTRRAKQLFAPLASGVTLGGILGSLSSASMADESSRRCFSVAMPRTCERLFS